MMGSPRLTGLPLLCLAAGLLAACSGGGPQAAPASGAADQEALPDAQEAGLITPEEAARTAEETIDSSNADSELERLQQEIEQG